MNYTQLLEEIKNHVQQILSNGQCGTLPYHNLEHTSQVVDSAIKIAGYHKLGDSDFFTVVAAAWFHDAGYCINDGNNHEQAGAAMAESFLKDKGLDDGIITAIKNCILATKLPQSPGTLLEKIVCDADLSHFGENIFFERSKLMRREAGQRGGNKIPKDGWRQSTIALLELHHYHTDYAKTFLQPVKNKNLEALKRKLAAEKEKLARQEDGPVTTIITKKKKEKRPERGIETMFRVTSANSLRLSDMADRKAHILITTTSIIISVLLSVLIRKLDEHTNLVIPTFILLFICVVTMVLSILATKPTITAGTFSPDDLKNKKVNLFFFGNFYKMPFEGYESGIKEMMNDADFLYGTFTRDLYAQGRVLGRKYMLLSRSYSVFMYGIILSVVAFITASFFPS